MYLKLATAKTANGIAPWMKSWNKFNYGFGDADSDDDDDHHGDGDADHHGDDSDGVNHMMMVDSDLIPVVAPLHVGQGGHQQQAPTRPLETSSEG